MDPVLEEIGSALKEEFTAKLLEWNDAAGMPAKFPPWESDSHIWLRQARAALSAIEAAGFKIVGPEPTGKMIDAGAATFCLPHTFSARIENLEPSLADFLIAAIDGQPSRAWRAMWTAAPPRPVED